jgi:hypothetical protein
MGAVVEARKRRGESRGIETVGRQFVAVLD